MRENVIIAYRGATYELGQWPYGYGIWIGGTPQPQPVEGWPGTPEGWSAAWYRFASLEEPGTIVPVEQPSPNAGTPSFAGQPTTAQPPAAAQPAAAQSPPAQSATAQSATEPVTAVQTGLGQPMTGQGDHGSGQPAAGQTPNAEPTAGQASALSGQQAAASAPYGQRPYAAPAAFARPVAAPVAVSQRRSRLAAGLLATGVVLGIIGLFPGYLGGLSLASQAVNLWPHLLYLAAWAACAALIVRGGSGTRIGALLGVGVSAVTFGLFFADLGTVIADGSQLGGAGLWLSLIGWLFCAAGAAAALGRRPADWPRQLRGRDTVVAVTLMLAALGAAITFAPSWDSFTLTSSAGASQIVTLGNAFANPGPVIFGDVVVMIALFVAAIAAAFWRPSRFGWALAAGASVPMVAQAISAFIQVSEPTPSTQFGISASQAAQAGLKIANGFTGVFWGYCAFIVVLLITTALLAASRDGAPAMQVGWARPGLVGAMAPGGPFVTGVSPSYRAPGYQSPTYQGPYATPGPSNSPTGATPPPVDSADS